MRDDLSSSDGDNDFSSALRGAQEEEKDSSVDLGGTEKPSTEARTPSTRKREKNEGSGEEDAAAVLLVPQAEVPSQKPNTPLAAFINFVAYRGASDRPATSNSSDVSIDDNGVKAATDVKSKPVNVPSIPKVSEENLPPSATVAPPIDKPRLSGEVEATAPTNKGTLSRGESMTLPLSYHPILLTGIGLGHTARASASAVEAPVERAANAASAAAIVPEAGSLTVDPQPANDAAQLPAPSPKDTAFAMRLAGENTTQVSEIVEPEKAPAQQRTSPANAVVAAAVEQLSKDDGKQHPSDSSNGQDSQFGAAYLQAAATGRAEAVDKPAFAEAENTLKSASTDELTNKPVVSEPLRNLLLQLKSDDNRRVDVRLIERAGELHVAVKAADPALTERLQQHMPELTSRLESERFTHEVWMPKLSESQRSESGSDSHNASSGGDGQPNFTSNNDAGRRNGGQSRNRPDWVDLLENQIG